MCLFKRNTKPRISSHSREKREAQIRLMLSKNAAAKGVEQKNLRNIANQTAPTKRIYYYIVQVELHLRPFALNKGVFFSANLFESFFGTEFLKVRKVSPDRES